jgi:hypothetical protein
MGKDLGFGLLFCGLGIFLFISGILDIRFSRTLPEDDQGYELRTPIFRKRGDFGFVLGPKQWQKKESSKDYRDSGRKAMIWGPIIFLFGLFLVLVSAGIISV